MQPQQLQNGNLLVPQRVTDAEGKITGDVLVEIGPDAPEYQRWLDWMGRAGMRRAGRGSRTDGPAEREIGHGLQERKQQILVVQIHLER